MDKFREAFDAGRNAVQRRAEVGVLRDPVGEEHEQAQLRAMGKSRFIFIRGIIGFSVPMFLWVVLTRLPEDVHAAQEFHRSTLSYLLHSWVTGFFICAFFGSVVGLLAWRRLVSEVWPGAEPDLESSITTLGPLSPK
jgi:hypothetical protein